MAAHAVPSASDPPHRCPSLALTSHTVVEPCTLQNLTLDSTLCEVPLSGPTGILYIHSQVSYQERIPADSSELAKALGQE